MGELSKAVIRSGIIDESFLLEMNKWKLPQSLPEEPPFTSSEEVCAAIEDAQESHSQVEVRVSDPDILKQYMGSKRAGRLVLKDEDKTAKFDWEYGLSPTGLYIMQWSDDVATDVLCNGASYLWDGAARVYFNRVQDLYFGEKRVFILCTQRKSNDASNPV